MCKFAWHGHVATCAPLFVYRRPFTTAFSCDLHHTSHHHPYIYRVVKVRGALPPANSKRTYPIHLYMAFTGCAIPALTTAIFIAKLMKTIGFLAFGVRKHSADRYQMAIEWHNDIDPSITNDR